MFLACSDLQADLPEDTDVCNYSYYKEITNEVLN